MNFSVLTREDTPKEAIRDYSLTGVESKLAVEKGLAGAIWWAVFLITFLYIRLL